MTERNSNEAVVTAKITGPSGCLLRNYIYLEFIFSFIRDNNFKDSSEM